jgi:hypothetical protein
MWSDGVPHIGHTAEAAVAEAATAISVGVIVTDVITKPASAGKTSCVDMAGHPSPGAKPNSTRSF